MGDNEEKIPHLICTKIKDIEYTIQKLKCKLPPKGESGDNPKAPGYWDNSAKDFSKEKWAPINQFGWSKYLVSNLGRVNIKKKLLNKKTKKTKMMTKKEKVILC